MSDRRAVLHHHLEHYAYRDVSDHIASIDHYTTLAAEQWMMEGRRTNVLEIAIHPPVAFLRNYILRFGIRDGATGFLVSVLNWYYVFMKLVKLWEMQHRFSRNVGDEGSNADSRVPTRAPSPEPRAQSPKPRYPSPKP